MTAKDTAPGTVAEEWLLRLYVARPAAVTSDVVESLRRACEQACPGSCRLDVVDVQQQPQMAETDKILATPTLVRVQPPPPRRLVGDLSDTREVLNGLDLPIIEPDGTVGEAGQ